MGTIKNKCNQKSPLVSENCWRSLVAYFKLLLSLAPSRIPRVFSALTSLSSSRISIVFLSFLLILIFSYYAKPVLHFSRSPKAISSRSAGDLLFSMIRLRDLSFTLTFFENCKHRSNYRVPNIKSACSVRKFVVPCPSSISPFDVEKYVLASRVNFKDAGARLLIFFMYDT